MAILAVIFSCNTKADNTMIAKNDNVMATGYAVFKFIFDRTYSHVRNPAMYKDTPINRLKLINW